MEASESNEELRRHYALVRYMRALDGQQERPVVWQEHSYSAPRRCCGRGGHGCGGHIDTDGPELRSVCVRKSPRCQHCRNDENDAEIDVTHVAALPPLPAHIAHTSGDSPQLQQDVDADTKWEEQLILSAPTEAHASLARRALAALDESRLQILATRGVDGAVWRSQACALAARRLRRLLALHHREGGWLLGALGTRGGAEVAALRSLAPDLVSRLSPWQVAPSTPGTTPSHPRPRHERPTLLWLPSGDAKEDVRWENKFRLLFPMKRVLEPLVERCSVERWCAAVLERARGAVRGAAGGAVVVCGAGAGAALALQLCAGASHAMGVLALGAPRHTAEGAWRVGGEGTCKSLLVRGGRAAGEWGARARVLVVGGAGDDLRVSPRSAFLTRRPQFAIDALIVDECEQWLLELVAHTDIEQKKTHLEGVESAPSVQDILRMPIVFADDEPEGGGKRVQAGGARGGIGKVIVAKRGRTTLHRQMK